MKRICVPIVETTSQKALQAIKEASRLADLIELRVDYMRNPELERLIRGGSKPLIVTNRIKQEGGRRSDDERTRVRIFTEAIHLGTDYVDIEMRSPNSLLQAVMEKKKKAQIILSFHDFQKTPPFKELRNICDRMAQLGADLAKVVTFARSWEDSLTLLSLIPYARKRRQRIIAFCMGREGKMSRIFAPLMGAPWTYASLGKKRSSAPGQLTVSEMKDIWRRLK